MDSINITYAKLKLTGAQKSALEIQLDISKRELEKVQLNYTALLSVNSLLKQAIEAEKLKTVKTAERYQIELDYYKALKSPKVKTFLLGAGAGALVAFVLALTL